MVCALSILALCLTVPSPVPSWHRICSVDASPEPLSPYVVQGARYTYPEGDVPSGALAGSAIGRNVVFGSTVRLGFLGVKPSERYRLRAWFFSDCDSRVQSVSIGDVAVARRIRLPYAKPVQYEWNVPASALSGGRLEFAVGRVEGPNAVLSRLDVLSTRPHRLQALPSLEERLARIRLAPRLSPKPDQCRLSLDGEWRFSPRPATGGAKTAWKPIRVPGEWTMQGFDVKPDAVVAYRRSFTVPTEWRGKRLKLRFDTVHSAGSVWVNGTKAGDFEGVFTPFELDVTKRVKPGGNELALTVRSASLSDTLASGSQYAAHPLGGILRHVTLFAIPQTNIESLDAVAKLGRNGAPTQLRVSLTARNEGKAFSRCTARLALTDPSGKAVALAKRSFGPFKVGPGGQARIDAPLRVADPQLWDPEHPRLYTLTVRLSSGAGTETVTRRVGLREVRVKGNRLLVNDRPVKLHGVCRHEVHPLLGRSLTPELCREDARLFRQANCNYIRTSHYPPSEEFLDACDELGLFVESEAPICWVQHGANTYWKDQDYQSKQVFVRMLRANILNVVNNRLHPSIIIWSLANESLWSPLWARTLREVKALDPSRPTSFHDQCWGSFNAGGSKADIAVFHYPGENGPEACDREKRPVLFGEYAHLQTYNRHELYTDPGVRDDWGRPFARMVDMMWAHDGCLGGAIWSGIDDTFHLPNGKIVGYGPWGPIDGWRRPKPEYWHVARAYTPVRVLNSETVSSPQPELRLVVENRYDFTDLSEVRVEWAMGDLRGTVKAFGAPHSRSTVALRLPRAPLSGDTIDVRFTDPRGFVCEHVSVSPPHPVAEPTAATGVPLALAERPEEYELANREVSLRVNRTTGQVKSVSIAGRTFAVSGPVPMVLPLNDDSGGPGGNDYQNRIEPFNPVCLPIGTPRVSARQEGDGVLVAVEGKWTGIEGGWEARFAPTGELRIHYRFTATQAVNPRQWGLVFHLPREMDTLRWTRTGLWSVYPEDHIGRLSGMAKANPIASRSVEQPRVRPNGPWSEDSSPMGTNDFRSTKSGVRTARLVSSDGYGLEVRSDGKQAVRAFVDGDSIGLLVAGFNTGGSDGFFGMHYAAERKQLKVGDAIEDVVVTRLLRPSR